MTGIVRSDIRHSSGASTVTAEGVPLSVKLPHIHFEIYPSEAMAKSYTTRLATSQLALPKAACDSVFAEDGFEASISNLAMIALTSDNVFSDGVASQTAEVTGSVSAGYTATLTAAVTSK